ncbi:hypothetical protein [uncultured Gammaproteobacteria bacterium]|nr:hypothetical protein BROOK1789B_1242 [Bathymodiolus brooksi thiotrophic gill symbiont]CAC9619012.1 hypothetical protein [uncultured Gammaproteobacteria bacterium]
MNMARIHFFPLGIFLNLVLAQLGQDFKKFTEWTQKMNFVNHSYLFEGFVLTIFDF